MGRKITKTFEIGISGKYQSYRFGTTETINVPDEMELKKIEETEMILSNNVRKSTYTDIIAYVQGSEDFQLVLASRREELDRYHILLSKTGKLPDLTDSNLFKG